MPNISLLKRLGKIVFTLLFIGLTMVNQPGVAFGLTKEQKQAFDLGIGYFNTEEENTTCSLGASSPSGAVTVADSGSWQSGLQPPYILEQFAIETLKDIAKKLGADEKNTVTEEHTIALLAFMGGEGGDINNGDLFNPLNTGINAPDLVNGSHATDGLQSFKSFDAGVEATARTIVKPQYGRLASDLTSASTTAEQFMSALTYYQKYANNLPWAAASDPKQGYDQDAYYRERLSLVSGVKSNYNRLAGLVVGTPQKEQPLNIRDDAKIFFHPAGSSASTTNTSSSGGTGGVTCGSPAGGGIVANNVAQTAVNLSWPESWSPAVVSSEPGRTGPLVPKPEYKAALTQFNPTGASAPAAGADCGVFVATVLHATGADPNYPPVGTGIQVEYVRNHPEKYDVVEKVNSTADLQAGDIMIVNGGGGSGHTFIFTGRQANGNDIASASLNDRMPNLGKSYVRDDRGFYTRARLR